MEKANKELEELTIPKGTVIHLKGIPFELPEDTKVLGLKSNFELANYPCSASISQSEHSFDNPFQAPPREAPVASLRTNNLSFPSTQDDR